MKEIVLAKPGDAQLIAALADEIWRQHYARFLKPPQLEYMLEKFQSVEKIRSQIISGEAVYYIMLDGAPAGYCGIETGGDEIYLSKLYIRKSNRNTGLARMMLAYLKENYPDKKSIYLNVDRRNEGSIEAYKKMGFSVCDEVLRDIGGGYVLDDYVMRCPLRDPR